MKTVLITGATRGIGRKTAELFALNGWKVIGIYRSRDDLAASLEAECGAACLKCDISDSKAVDPMRDEVMIRFGAPDVIVNNAGISLTGVFQTIDNDKRRALYENNLFGALFVTRAFIGDMINNKSGVIINVSSIFGESGGACEVDYSASKAALIGFTKALAKEVGPSCVRVNCVCPGIIDTDMNASLSVDDVRAIVDEIPLESLGTPANVAEAIFFLASDAAAYITGAVLDVNGGWM